MADSQPASEATTTEGANSPVTPVSSRNNKSSGPWVIAGLVIVLLILHQDNWFWENDTLVFGFLPMGLFWHVCISLGATLTWWLATKIAWPLDDSDSSGGPV